MPPDAAAAAGAAPCERCRPEGCATPLASALPAAPASPPAPAAPPAPRRPEPDVPSSPPPPAPGGPRLSGVEAAAAAVPRSPAAPRDDGGDVEEEEDEDDEDELLLLLLLLLLLPWRRCRLVGFIMVPRDLRNVSCRRWRREASFVKGRRRRCWSCWGVSGEASSRPGPRDKAPDMEAAAAATLAFSCSVAAGAAPCRLAASLPPLTGHCGSPL